MIFDLRRQHGKDSWLLTCQTHKGSDYYYAKREVPRLAEHDDVMEWVANSLEEMPDQLKTLYPELLNSGYEGGHEL